jgi:hypothetical protein
MRLCEGSSIEKRMRSLYRTAFWLSVGFLVIDLVGTCLGIFITSGPLGACLATASVFAGFFGLCSLLLSKSEIRLIRVREGRCRDCGYDLRATPTRCPECGLVPTPPQAQA